MYGAGIYNDVGSTTVWVIPPSQVRTGNTIWVDAVYGNDATGILGDFVFSFKTIQAAIYAASTGDTIRVRPGIYAEDVLMAGLTNVSLQLDDGVVIVPTSSGVSMNSCSNCSITGFGAIAATGSVPGLSLIANSECYIHCIEITSVAALALYIDCGSNYVKTLKPIVTTGNSTCTHITQASNTDPMTVYIDTPCFTDNAAVQRNITGAFVDVSGLLSGSFVKINGDILPFFQGVGLYIHAYTSKDCHTEWNGNFNNAANGGNTNYVGISIYDGALGDIIINTKTINVAGNGRGVLIQTNNGAAGDNTGRKIIVNGIVTTDAGEAFSVKASYLYDIYFNGQAISNAAQTMQFGDNGFSAETYNQNYKVTLNGRIENKSTNNGIQIATLGTIPPTFVFKNIDIFCADAGAKSVTATGATNVWGLNWYSNRVTQNVTSLMDALAVNAAMP